MTSFDLLIFVVAILIGATASIVGFGIGTVLTPLFAIRYGVEGAIAVVTLPHAIATAVRCWRLRLSIDRAVVLHFGLLSAAAALIGALVYTRFSSASLVRVLGFVLVLTAVAQVTNLASRWKPRGPLVGLVGALSGFFGGIVGSQGGIRAAALVSFNLMPAAFVATSTAIGLMVDLARLPVYLVKSADKFLLLVFPIATTTIGVLAGTLIGERVLTGISRGRFSKAVASAIGILGIWFMFGTA